MKYRSIGKMREKIQEWRLGRQPVKWVEICRRLNILTSDGKPNTGLAQDIGYKTVNIHGQVLPYEPIDRDVRIRLGLNPDICPECHRSIRSRGHKEHSQGEVPAYMRWWQKLNPQSKRAWIEMLHEYDAGKSNPFE